MKIIATDKQPYDLLVVGAGAAGSVIAAKAVQAGKRVLMLEAGPARSTSSLVSSQIWARKLKWSGDAVEEHGNLKIGHGFNAGFGTGGSAVHHYGVWPRLHENDFSMRTQHKIGNDWPFDYKELRPYYDQIQTEVGLSGDAVTEKWRPAGEPYPMGPLPVFTQGKTIAAGFEKLGLSTAPIPMAINSVPQAGRQACQYDGWCDAGCPTGALANPLVTYLPIALKGGASIIHDATVTRVLHDASGHRVAGVEYVDANGQQHSQMADVVVLAAFAVQNARLLLASISEKHKRGLANNNDMVGRYLMTHPSVSIYGLFENETQPYLGPTGGQLINHDNYDNKRAIKEAFGSYQWLIANALKPNDLLGIATTRPDIYGAALDPFMKKASQHMGTMTCVGEAPPNKDNRVQLSVSVGRYGMPLAKATHNIGAETQALLQHAIAEGKEVFSQAGAGEPWAGQLFGMHLMGGTIMGSNIESSVTDANGQCHDVQNLYIAGPGLFPTSGAVNPTYTVHALAARTAQKIFA